MIDGSEKRNDWLNLGILQSQHVGTIFTCHISEQMLCHNVGTIRSHV